MSLILTLLILLGTKSLIASKQALQQQRVSFLQTQLDQWLLEQKQLQRLLQQLQQVEQKNQHFESLERQRSKVTRLMSLLAQHVPDGIYLERVEARDLQVELKGFAHTSQALTLLTERLQNSTYIDELSVRSILHQQQRWQQNYQAFHLSFHLRLDVKGE